MRRRQFLCSSLMAGGAAAAALRDFPYHLFASDRKKYATDVVTLGRTGIKLSRLAQGSGTVGTNKSSNQTRKLGLYGLSDLYRATVDAGLNFWDTADQYGSHPHICEALKTVKREGVVIMTKTRASTEAEMRDDLDRFRRELGTDYLDIVLLHCMLDTDWPEKKKGAMMVLSEAKEKGIIRAHGTSCHKIGALRTAAATDWVEVDLARLNPVGSHIQSGKGAGLPPIRPVVSDRSLLSLRVSRCSGASRPSAIISWACWQVARRCAWRSPSGSWRHGAKPRKHRRSISLGH